MMASPKLLSLVSYTSTNLVVSWLLAVIHGAGNPSTLVLAKIVLATHLNVFALPLAHTPALSLPLWIYYVLSVLWLRQLVHHSQYSIPDIIRELEADAQQLRS